MHGKVSAEPWSALDYLICEVASRLGTHWICSAHQTSAAQMAKLEGILTIFRTDYDIFLLGICT
jgi:hypothetical protein